ncbi:hypothetical protein BDP27DRAFT_1418902 [Rhodocollybia butyracea]|uniref:FAD/NAD(P)-binding domain-containing protein n=1 Tax=Rhodocollybia butyracea TaxID=206335 RepID=A0A9P5PSK9_9AGAR|nr:hypothetical protein BDP27DRAFT_1418902 [Rhodocollybia butyracea]
MSIDAIPPENNEENHDNSNSNKPNIIVVGASYVGEQSLYSKLKTVQLKSHPGSKVVDDLIPLVHETHNIIVVEKSSHFQNVFAFPRLHAVPGFENSAFVPYSSDYFKEARNSIAEQTRSLPSSTQIVHGLVTSVLPNEIVLETGETIPYEYLILATGTGQRTTFENIKTAHKVCHRENDKTKGISLIHSWQADIEKAESIIVVGGGAYGVQLVTDIKTHEPTSFHHSLHDITMEKIKEYGIDTVLGQRAVKIEKVEERRECYGGNGLANGNGKAHRKEEFVVHLSARIRTNLVDHLPRRDTALRTSPHSRPIRYRPQTGYIRVLPTLQIDTSSDGKSTSYPNVFALGDVADTGAHKAARPGHFQSGVVTRNIQRLIESNQKRRLKCNGNGHADGVEHIIDGISMLGKSRESLESLESYTPLTPGIHLRLGMKDSLIFRNPAPGSTTPGIHWDEPGSSSFDCGCERYWKRRAETFWKNRDLSA